MRVTYEGCRDTLSRLVGVGLLCRRKHCTTCLFCPKFRPRLDPTHRGGPRVLRGVAAWRRQCFAQPLPRFVKFATIFCQKSSRQLHQRFIASSPAHNTPTPYKNFTPRFVQSQMPAFGRKKAPERSAHRGQPTGEETIGVAPTPVPSVQYGATARNSLERAPCLKISCDSSPSRRS